MKNFLFLVGFFYGTTAITYPAFSLENPNLGAVNDFCRQKNNFVLSSPVTRLYPIVIYERNPCISKSPFLEGRILYGKDIQSTDCKEDSHAERVCLTLLSLLGDVTFLFTYSPESIDSHGSKIINMSCGIIDNNEFFTPSTENFLSLLFHHSRDTFPDLLTYYLKHYLREEKGDQEKKKILDDILAQSSQPDEYFLFKWKETLTLLVQNVNESDVFIAQMRKQLTQFYLSTRTELTSSLLGKDYLIVQSLENGGKPLTSNNCSFDYPALTSSKKRDVVFARNLCAWPEDPSGYILPEDSQIPGKDFADRTLCVITPTHLFNLKKDKVKILESPGRNSDAAPWVSASIYWIRSKLGENYDEKTICDCLLKTATRLYKPDPLDKIVKEGDTYSLTYGAGLINPQAALSVLLNPRQ